MMDGSKVTKKLYENYLLGKEEYLNLKEKISSLSDAQLEYHIQIFLPRQRTGKGNHHQLQIGFYIILQDLITSKRYYQYEKYLKLVDQQFVIDELNSFLITLCQAQKVNEINTTKQHSIITCPEEKVIVPNVPVEFSELLFQANNIAHIKNFDLAHRLHLEGYSIERYILENPHCHTSIDYLNNKENDLISVKPWEWPILTELAKSHEMVNQQNSMHL